MEISQDRQDRLDGMHGVVATTELGYGKWNIQRMDTAPVARAHRIPSERRITPQATRSIEYANIRIRQPDLTGQSGRMRRRRRAAIAPPPRRGPKG